MVLGDKNKPQPQPVSDHIQKKEPKKLLDTLILLLAYIPLSYYSLSYLTTLSLLLYLYIDELLCE